MAQRIAVTDTSVLINLHHLNLLNPLSLLFSRVLVPAPVRVEFLVRDKAGSLEFALTTLTSQGLFMPCDSFDSVDVGLLKATKMNGAEAEALSQAKIKNADFLLIDEKIGRRQAVRERRQVMGTAGVLVEFHKLGIVDFHISVARIKADLGFRINGRVFEQCEKELRSRSLD